MKLLSSLEDTSALFTGPAKISALGALGESYVSDVRNMLFSLKPSNNSNTNLRYLKTNVPFFRLMRRILGDFSLQVPFSLHQPRNLEIPKFARCTPPFQCQLHHIMMMITSLWKVAEEVTKIQYFLQWFWTDHRLDIARDSVYYKTRRFLCTIASSDQSIIIIQSFHRYDCAAAF